VTPLPQGGNEKPRLFRLVKDQAIINRMGFNNVGAEKMRENILRSKRGLVKIGVNIGKNKITPNENALDDYLKCFEALYDVADYFVVNVSSPNTPDLRALQEKEPLKKILNELQAANSSKPKRKPILLKIAPDLNNDQLNDIVEIIFETKLDGIVATNTTIGRENLLTSKDEVKTIGAGGLSGKPLTNRSTEIIKYLHERSQGKIPIVAVGGIMKAEDAIEKLNAGAVLVQLYTGFIYDGPGLVKEINKKLIQ
jgi:dihydroorotate dehydrogenase